MDLRKTRTKKSSPDMFNFYVVLTGHDKIISDTGRAITCRRKFKAPSLQTKSTKTEGPPENMVFKEKRFEDFRQKKNRILFSTSLKKPSSIRGP